MEIQRLKEFLVLADVISISKAATVLDIKQPVLSRHLQELERDVGVSLLVRGTSQAALTPPGKRFAILAQEIVEMADELAKEVSGSLKLSA